MECEKEEQEQEEKEVVGVQGLGLLLLLLVPLRLRRMVSALLDAAAVVAAAFAAVAPLHRLDGPSAAEVICECGS